MGDRTCRSELPEPEQSHTHKSGHTLTRGAGCVLGRHVQGRLGWHDEAPGAYRSVSTILTGRVRKEEEETQAASGQRSKGSQRDQPTASKHSHHREAQNLPVRPQRRAKPSQPYAE